MGLLDQITQMAGSNGNIMDQLKGNMLEGALSGITSKYPQLADMLKNVDTSKLNEIAQFVQQNGIPDTKEEVMALIQKLSK